VRLTLRTLLAYLDDTLEPSETKMIGQKVAESDAAQELIARIKQVTRRRRLTTPPATGPNAFEPNTVAEYLDNALSPEQMVEIEKSCLDSDVHLAEIAAVHQILTLVLGQPALVPPTARQRMYALVHGRKSSRARPVADAALPNGATAPAVDAHPEDDDTLLLGLPHYRRQAAMRWLLPLAAALLLVVIGVALWGALPFGGTTDNRQAAVTDTGKPPELLGTPKAEPPQNDNEQKPNGDNKNDGQKPNKPGTTPGDGSANEGKPGQSIEKKLTRPGPPSQERREIGTSRRIEPSVLVSRNAPGDSWQIVKPGAKVATQNLLVSLPGYRSDLRLDSGVGLTLTGTAYEFRSPFLESAVVLHAAAADVDADFTLDRGAVLITNYKDKPAQVRVRFLGEIWDVALEEPDAEVGVALLSRHVLPYGSGEPPNANGFVVVRKGRASVRVSPYVEYPNLEPVREGRRNEPIAIFWDSVGKGAERPVPVARGSRAQALIGVFDPPLQPDMEKAEQDRILATQAALQGLSGRLAGAAKVETALVETIQKGEAQTLQAILAVRCLGALDAVGDLVNVLDDTEKEWPVRIEAIITLRHWIGRNAGQEAGLYDPSNGGGVLTKGGKFVATDALAVMELLHNPGDEQLASPAFWAALIEHLRSEKLAIRELALFHLQRWVPEARMIAYDPNGPQEARRAGYDAWKKLIPDGKLPPTRPR
jgi:hypothetical protein